MFSSPKDKNGKERESFDQETTHESPGEKDKKRKEILEK